MRRLALTVGLSLLAVSASRARPFSVEDLIDHESFGRAAFDRTGHWLVYERRGPHVSAPSFADTPLGDQRESRLRVVDLQHGPHPTPLIRGDPMGVAMGPISPDGRRVAVYRVGSGGSTQLGIVTLGAGAVRWFGIHPRLPVDGRTAEWMSADRLLVIASDASGQQVSASEGQSLSRLSQRWRDMAAGSTTVSAVGSGRFKVPREAGQARLMAVHAGTGVMVPLVSGDLQDLAIAPDRRHVALLIGGETIPLASGRPVQGAWGTATQRRRLQIYDMASHRSWRPCADCDLATQPLAWSPSGQQLLGLVRRDGEPWTAGQVMRFEADQRRLTPVEIGGAAAVLSYRPETARAAWLGETPVVYARTANGRLDWIAAMPTGARPLTAGLETSPARVQATPLGLLAVADGLAWRIAADGSHHLGALSGLKPPPPAAVGPNGVALTGPGPWFAATRMTSEGSAAIVADDTGGLAQIALPSPASRVLGYSSQAGAVLSMAADLHGVETLHLSRTSRPTLQLDQVNTGLADVEPVRVLEVDHRDGDGRPIKSWLYLPATSPGQGPPPLVVVPYLGGTFATPLTAADFAQPAYMPSVPAILGRGYAVLLPSLPVSAGKEPLAGLADRVLSIVAAAAQSEPGAFDPDRLAVWGHSYGGYTAMALIAQTDRFRAAIESAGPTDLVSLWGEFGASWRLDPADTLGVSWNTGWVETAQGAMGSPPWDDPARYVRNSPLFMADHIQTPLLMIQGDQDEVGLGQGEEMFSALYRQGRDAQLVTYWGEGHAIRSPGNVRDLYARAFDWLERNLARPITPGTGAPLANPGSGSATIGPKTRSSQRSGSPHCARRG